LIMCLLIVLVDIHTDSLGKFHILTYKKREQDEE
jgi:hypothetical protein